MTRSPVTASSHDAPPRPARFADAIGLAALLRDGALAAVDVVEDRLAAIARSAPRLNAVVTLDAEGARRRARAADEARRRGESLGPLHGVPVTIKDVWDTAGVRTTSGTWLARHNVPTRDATVVERLAGAGAIVLGKTNVPLGSYDWQTVSPIFGRTSNPWDPTRTPGGSSGGSAAAVAAGLSALDVGSDACGSIRMPAHCCGVFGLKPTEHRVSSAGHGAVPGYPFAMRHLVSYGPLARSVRDLRLALSLIEGPDPRLADVPPLAERADPARPVDRERPLRLLWVEALDGVPADAATRATLRALAARLAAAGHAVEERQPALDAVEAMRLWGEINGAELAGTTGAAIAAAMRLAIGTRLGRSPITVGLRRGLGGSMRRYAEALERRDAVIAALDASLAGYDALLCPTAAVPAIPHQRTGAPVSVDGARAPYSLALGGHVAPFNLTGSPVVVVPAARSPEGLPIGVQLVGRRWDDAALLDAAERVAELVGWSEWPFA